MHWIVGYECVECGSEGDVPDDSSVTINASVAIRTLEDEDLISVDDDGRPLCLECDGIAVVWWTDSV